MPVQVRARRPGTRKHFHHARQRQELQQERVFPALPASGQQPHVPATQGLVVQPPATPAALARPGFLALLLLLRAPMRPHHPGRRPGSQLAPVHPELLNPGWRLCAPARQDRSVRPGTPRSMVHRRSAHRLSQDEPAQQAGVYPARALVPGAAIHQYLRMCHAQHHDDSFVPWCHLIFSVSASSALRSSRVPRCTVVFTVPIGCLSRVAISRYVRSLK